MPGKVEFVDSGHRLRLFVSLWISLIRRSVHGEKMSKFRERDLMVHEKSGTSVKTAAFGLMSSGS